MKSSNQAKILIIEDDLEISKHIKTRLSSYGRCFCVHTYNDAVEIINSNLGLTHAFIDLDLDIKLAGLDLIDKCLKQEIKCAILSSHESDVVVDKCIEKGVNSYYDKIDYFENYHNINSHFFETEGTDIFEYDDFFNFKYITTEKKIVENIKLILSNKISHDRIIQISGETGTGKSKLAKLLHEESDLDGEFIPFNVADISPNLIKSRLFGHVKGAFTDAVDSKKGVFEQADNGTLFIDEIGEMSLEMQKALLLAIENKEIWPEGAQKPVKCNVRVICAGNNILEKLKSGQFREDFYFRINDFVVNILPLRQRKDDIETQAIKFLKEFSKKKGLGHRTFTKESLQILKNYSWKGNSRELKNEMKRLIDSTDKVLIDVGDLPKKLTTHVEQSERFISDTHLEFILQHGYKEYIKQIENQIVEHLIINKKLSRNQASKKIKVSKDVMTRLYKNHQREIALCQ